MSSIELTNSSQDKESLAEKFKDIKIEQVIDVNNSSTNPDEETEPIVDQQHGHQHGHGGHSHGGHQHGGNCCGGKRKKYQRAPQDYFMMFFVILMPTNCVICEWNWFLEPYKENYFVYYGSLAFLIIDYIACIHSYYYAVTTRNETLQVQPPKERSKLADPTYKNNNKCDKCQNLWKPQRTSHCSQCGACTARMDHHCPWICNCVGVHNNKAFWLFTVWMMGGGLQYCYNSFMYALRLVNLGTFFAYSFWFYVYWTFVSMMMYPFTMMLVSLTFFHSCLGMSNLTTLQMMKGLSFNMPCFTPTSINGYDRGCIANIADYFNHDLFFWWWPAPTYHKTDATDYPVNQQVIEKHHQGDGSIDVQKCITDYENLVENEKEKYKDCVFKWKEQQFDFYKDYEKLETGNRVQQQQEVQQVQENDLNNIKDSKNESQI